MKENVLAGERRILKTKDDENGKGIENVLGANEEVL